MPEPTLNTNIGMYRSGVTSPERLRRTSVARQHLLDNAIESLRGSVDRKSKNHLLFIGPRGIGKTHLLSCIEDAVQSNETLSPCVVIVRFPEESNRTLSFADFLIGMCEILKEVLEDEPLWAELFAAVQTEEDDARVADRLVPAIREENRRRGRTLLVMLENLGEILDQQIRHKNHVAALRKFFMGDNGCLLLATAPRHFDGITDLSQPFYDFFDTQILDYLRFEETVEVIRLNLEWEERTDILETLDEMRPRLQALYQMTGGNPRLTMMLYELIAHESVISVQDQFLQLLDRISPFYQGRLNDLPPGQRALLECLASMRDQEKTPAAIAARMRMSQQETSSLLKRLTSAHYLRADRHPRDKRSRLYTIREGFFDIWLAMSLSRGARRRMPFLLDFFSLFYPSITRPARKSAVKLRAKLLEEGSDDAEKVLDYLSEVGGEGERATAKFDMARTLCPPRRCRSDGELRAGSRAPGRRRSEPVDSPHCRQHSVRSGLSLRNRGDDRVLGAAPQRRARGVCLPAGGDGGRTDPAHLLRDQTGVSARYPGKRGGFRGANRAAPEELRRCLMDLARWEEGEEQQRQALAEATALADSDLVARCFERAGARLLKRTNRLGEAEPLMRRALEINLAAFGDAASRAWRACMSNLAVSAAGHQPVRGGRAADAACPGDRRGLPSASSTRPWRFVSEQPGAFC